jgi:hypothetical protein
MIFGDVFNVAFVFFFHLTAELINQAMVKIMQSEITGLSGKTKTLV